MKKIISIIVLSFASLVFLTDFSKKNADNKYVVTKTTTGCKCTVQTADERPQMGGQILGPYDTKQEAIDAMCNNVDPDMSNTKKCWETNPKCK